MATALAVAWPALHEYSGVRDLDGVLVVSRDTLVEDCCTSSGLKIVTFHLFIDILDTDHGLAALMKNIMRLRNNGFVWVSHFWSGFHRN